MTRNPCIPPCGPDPCTRRKGQIPCRLDAVLVDLDLEFIAATRYAIFVGIDADRCIGEYSDQDQAITAAYDTLTAEPEGSLITQIIRFADGDAIRICSIQVGGQVFTYLGPER